MTRARIAAIDAGTYWHHRSLREPPFASRLDRLIYAPEIGRSDLTGIDVLLVTCRTDPDLLVPHRARIAAFLDGGGTVAAMGETGAERWLPGVDWTPGETNFWWWLTPGADSGVRIAAPDHALWRHLPPADVVWHHHGFLRPPPGAVSLVEAVGEGSLLYDDTATTAGRMIVTTLDPFYHHGSHFMPATTRFLHGFLPWLATL